MKYYVYLDFEKYIDSTGNLDNSTTDFPELLLI